MIDNQKSFKFNIISIQKKTDLDPEHRFWDEIEQKFPLCEDISKAVECRNLKFRVRSYI